MHKFLKYLSLLIFIISLIPSLFCLINIPGAINPALFWSDILDLSALILLPIAGEIALFFIIRRLLRLSETKPQKNKYLIGSAGLILLQIIFFLPLLLMVTLFYVPLPPT